MSWVATAIVGSSFISGYFGNEAADAAADASSSASRRAIAEQRRQFDTIYGGTAPYRQTGVNALAALNAEMGFNPIPFHDAYAAPGIYESNALTGTTLAEQEEQAAPQGGGQSSAIQAEIERLQAEDMNTEGQPNANRIRRLRQQLNAAGGGNALLNATNVARSDPKAGLGPTAAPGAAGVHAGGSANFDETAGSAMLGGGSNPALQQHMRAQTSSAASGGPQQEAGPQQPPAWHPTGGGFRADPGYRFRLEQGERAMGRRQAAGGNFLSGSGVREAMRFGSGLASQEYGNYWNRLASMAGIGQAATGQAGAAGMGAAGNIGNIHMQHGANVGNAAMMGAQSTNNAIQGGISNALLYNYLGTG